MDHFATWEDDVDQEIALLCDPSRVADLYPLVASIVCAIMSADLEDVPGGRYLGSIDKTF